jgi:hypothetical protein
MKVNRSQSTSPLQIAHTAAGYGFLCRRLQKRPPSHTKHTVGRSHVTSAFAVVFAYPFIHCWLAHLASCRSPTKGRPRASASGESPWSVRATSSTQSDPAFGKASSTMGGSLGSGCVTRPKTCSYKTCSYKTCSYKTCSYGHEAGFCSHKHHYDTELIHGLRHGVRYLLLHGVNLRLESLRGTQKTAEGTAELVAVRAACTFSSLSFSRPIRPAPTRPDPARQVWRIKRSPLPLPFALGLPFPDESAQAAPLVPCRLGIDRC